MGLLFSSQHFSWLLCGPNPNVHAVSVPGNFTLGLTPSFTFAGTTTGVAEHV